MKSMLEETLGFLSCMAVSRIFNRSLGFEFKRIQDPARRAPGQLFVVRLAERLLARRRSVRSMEELVGIVRDAEASIRP
jgi:5-methylthioribose kinase